MPRAERPRQTLVPPASDPPTLRAPPPALRPQPGDEDTIAVPLADAATLPCPPPAMDELPTLRAAPGELAELIERTRRSDAAPPIQPRAPQRSGRIAGPPVRHPDFGQTRQLPRGLSQRSPAGCISAMMPTQLWLGPVAAGPALPRPPQRRGFWARLWTLLGLTARLPRATVFRAGRRQQRHKGWLAADQR